MRGKIIVSALGCLIAFCTTGTPAWGSDFYNDGHGSIVRCESRDGRMRYCDIGGADARLVRQLSGAICERGRSWGTDGRGLWVSRGCRADFQIDYRGSGGWQGGQVFRCESRDGRARRCAVHTRGKIRMVRQLSAARCIQGRTWGRDRNGVWVAYGCRAEFQVVPRYAEDGYPWHDGDYGNDGSGNRILCESRDNRTNHCGIGVRWDVRLVRQLSSSPCIEGHSWGWNRSGLWVSRGCRAEFSVW